MADNTIQYAVKGLNLDSSKVALEKGEYTWALNALLSEKGFLENEPANYLCTAFPDGYLPIGHVNLEDSNETVYFLVDSTNNQSEIGKVDEFCNYTQIVNDDCLAFSIEHQIRAVYRPNSLCGRNIYWTDDFNPMRYMDIDDLPDPFDCDEIRVFPYTDHPCIQIEDKILTGGSLHSGVYYFTIQYADFNGNPKSASFSFTNPYPIIFDPLYANYYNVEGSIADTVTDKAIHLLFSSISDNFDYFNLIVVKKIDGIISAERVTTLPTSTTDYIYTGNEADTADITIDEAIQEPVVYDRAKEVLQTNKRLIWLNVGGRKQYNYQPYANNIGVRWVTKPITAFDNTENYKDPYDTVYFKTLMRDEVYALGIRFLFKDGTKSCVYHIPGREKNKKSTGDFITETEDQYGNSINAIGTIWDEDMVNPGEDNFDSASERWQVYNTAYDDGSVMCGGHTGQMGYWESDRTYPTAGDAAQIWGSLSGQPIRHHRMPDCSVTHIHNQQDSPYFTDQPEINILGVQVSNVIVPLDLHDQVDGWELVIGDRTNNESIIAKGLVFNMLHHDSDDYSNDPPYNTDFYYDNYPYNDVTYIIDTGTDPDKEEVMDTLYSFMAPECYFRTKNIASANEFKIETEEDGIFIFNNYADTTGVNTDRSIAYNIGKVSTSLGLYDAFQLAQYGDVRRSLTNKEYIVNNTIQGSFAGLIANQYRESYVLLETGTGLTGCQVTDDSRNTTDNAGNGVMGVQDGDGDLSAYYISIKNNSRSQYGNIDDIRYNAWSACKISLDVDTSCLFPGDCFINLFSLHKRLLMLNFFGTRFVFNGEEAADGSSFDSTFEAQGTLFDGVPLFFVESTINIDYRYSGQDKWDQVYPTMENYKWFQTNFFQWQRPKYTWLDVDNAYLYNFDYSSLNDLRIPCVAPSVNLALCANEYPTRAIYSQQQTEESIVDSYLIYQANSYFDYPKEDGEIWQGFASGDTLYVRTKTNIYQHKLNFQQLETDVNNIIVGTGALFAIPPVQMAKIDNGYGGTTSQWALNLTPYGYFFLDNQNGRVFNFEQGLNEISQNKTFRFFKEQLPTILDKQVDSVYGQGTFTNFDNPANPDGIGYLSAWDNESLRWILTKRDYSLVDPNSLGVTGTVSFSDGKFYKNNTHPAEEVPLTDTDVFCNKSFTVSYSPLTKRWLSFHSYLPGYYVTNKTTFLSSNLTSNIYAHDDRCIFQTFYGEIKPFMVEITNILDGSHTFTSPSIQWTQEEFTCTNSTDVLVTDMTFNKAYVYNENSHSGLLNLALSTELNLNTILALPTDNVDSRTIQYSDKENTFSFSDFENISKYPDKQVYLNTNSCTNADFIAAYPIDKVPDINNLDFAKIWYERERFRGNWISYRLIQDARNDFKLTTNFFLLEPVQSIR